MTITAAWVLVDNKCRLKVEIDDIPKDYVTLFLHPDTVESLKSVLNMCPSPNLEPPPHPEPEAA